MGQTITSEDIVDQLSSIFRRLNNLEKKVDLAISKQLKESYISINITDTDETSNSYVDVLNALLKINFSNWFGQSFYFEAVFKVTSGTGSVQLYNNTDASAVSGSEITTTSTDYVLVRSGEITKLEGEKDLIVQIKTTAGTISLSGARIVFKQP